MLALILGFHVQSIVVGAFVAILTYVIWHTPEDAMMPKDDDEDHR